MAVIQRTKLDDDVILVHEGDVDTNGTDNQKSHDVVGGPATIKNAKLVNGDSSATSFKVYNAVAPTEGSSNPELILYVPATSTRSVRLDREFDTAISFAGADEDGIDTTTASTDLAASLEIHK